MSSPFFARTDKHNLVAGDQTFANDVQIGGILQGSRKEIVTATDGQVLGAVQSGAVVILATGIDVLLPPPEAGLNYKFITTAAIGGTAATIKSTSDGSTASNLMSGIVKINNVPTATTTQVDTISLVASTATEGDFVDVECTGVASDGVAATAAITVTDGDAASGMAENEKVTLIDGNGVSVNYIIVDDQLSPAATGDVVTSGVTDVGTTTATSSGIAVTIDITGTPVTQNAFLVQLKAAIENANSAHSSTITCGSVIAADDGLQTLTLTQVVTGVSGATVIDVSSVAQLSNSTDFQQSNGKWIFRAFGDAASSITAT